MAATSTPLTSQQRARLAQTTPDSCDGRSICTHCLQQKGCMIGTYGDCASHGYADYIDKYTNFTLALSRGLDLPDALQNSSVQLSARQYWQFKAGDVMYCDTQDETCQLCVSKKFWSSLSYPDSRFCVGNSGCVCIFNCEFRCNSLASASGTGSGAATPATTPTTTTTTPKTTTPPRTTPIPTYRTSMSPQPSTTSPPSGIDLVASSPPATTPSTRDSSGHPLTMDAFVYGAIPVLMLTFFILRCSKRNRMRRERLERQQRAEPVVRQHTPGTTAQPPPSAPPAEDSDPIEASAPAARPTQLELYGWISHRQGLIDTERRRLNGDDDVIPWTRFQTPSPSSHR